VKIRDVKLVELAGHHPSDFCVSVERLSRPLDIYPEFRDEPTRIGRAGADPVPIRHIYVEVHTDSEVGR